MEKDRDDEDTTGTERILTGVPELDDLLSGGIHPGKLTMLVSPPRNMKLVRELEPGDEVRFPNGKWYTVASRGTGGGFPSTRSWIEVKYVGDNRTFCYQINAKRETR